MRTGRSVGSQAVTTGHLVPSLSAVQSYGQSPWVVVKGAGGGWVSLVAELLFCTALRGRKGNLVVLSAVQSFGHCLWLVVKGAGGE